MHIMNITCEGIHTLRFLFLSPLCALERAGVWKVVGTAAWLMGIRAGPSPDIGVTGGDLTVVAS